jgi:hypothetical protein
MQMPKCLTSIIGVLLLCSIVAMGQYTTASLAGTVLDNTGASIPAVRVTVRNVDTGFEQTTVTDNAGAFLFARLPIGNYELVSEHSGFSTYRQTGIRLTVNQAASQIVTMQVGQVAERVTVEANAELVTTRTGAVGQVIDEKKIVELPLNGRVAPVARLSRSRNGRSRPKRVPDLRSRRRLPG